MNHNQDYLEELHQKRNSRKLMIQELMINQMEDSLGRNIKQYVNSTRQFLNRVGPSKARKVVVSVEKKLNNFMKGAFPIKIQFGCGSYDVLRENEKSMNITSGSIFNMRLLQKQGLKSANKERKNNGCNVLIRNLPLSSRGRSRGEKNNLLTSRVTNGYLGKHLRKQSDCCVNWIQNI